MTSQTQKVSPPVSHAYRKETSWNPLVFIERKLFGIYWHVESVFALSMLEAWEVLLVIMVFLTLTSLILYSLIFYFPRHIQLVARRAMYYVYGTVPSSATPASSVGSLGASAPKAAAAASEAASLLSGFAPSSTADSIKRSAFAAASKLEL